MTRERDHRYASASSDTSNVDQDIAPGRGARSAQLMAPAYPIASGLIRRKARDANGVADGAEQAIATAASSSGHSLPLPIMRKFESSVGVDLSTVRVHTGAESAAAAAAVGAKAYTVGQDIHFGADHYDPWSAAGQHLLAHEVAHTVQQRGGMATRQNKLEVSTPFDAAEHEADRAADAMVAGRSAAVSGSHGVARKTVMRDQDDDVELPDVAKDQATAADKAEDQTKTDAKFVVQGLMSTVSDSGAAQRLMETIQSHQDNVTKGEGAGVPGWQGASAANTAVLNVLEQFLASNGVENTAVSQFAQQYQRVQIDFNRLDASMHAFQAGNPGAGPEMANAGGDPGKLVSAIRKGAQLTSFDDKNMQKDIGEGGPAYALWKDARDKKNEVTDTSTAMQKWQGDTITNMHTVASLQAEISGGVRAATAPDEEAKAALEAVKSKCEGAKNAWEKVSGIITKGVGAIVPEGGKEAADKVLEQVPALIDAYFAQAIATAQLASDNSAKLNDLRAIAAKGQQLQAAQTALSTAVNQYIAVARKLDRTRKEYLAAMDKLGAKLDEDGKTGNHAYAQIAKLTAEGQNFITDAETVIAMGKTEASERGHVNEQKDKLVNKDTGKGMPWYSVRSQTDLEHKAGVNGGSYGILVWNQVSVSDTQGSNTSRVDGVPMPGGSATGKDGANQMIDKQIEQLQTAVTLMKGTIAGLQKMMGF